MAAMLLNNGEPAPTVVCLHFLGGSASEWRLVSDRLGTKLRCLALDLPGFGSKGRGADMSVSEMADAIAETLSGELCGPWWLVGHSMGAKIALVLAHRAEAGEAGLADLKGLVVVAGSPPSPEPMSDDKRASMMAWIDADPRTRRRKAEDFITENVGGRLDQMLETEAVEDVLRADPLAWKAWLNDGCREDWCRTIGVLQTPALILSGTADTDLGPSAQNALMAPHFARYDHVEISGAGHLLPLERPNAVADHIAAFTENATPSRRIAVAVGNTYRALIASDRVNSRLRAALSQRAEIDNPAYQPKCLDPVELSILRAVCDRVAPQPGASVVDIAARIDSRLASCSSDGWRFATLPVDVNAYRLGLRTLDTLARRSHGGPFVTLDQPIQDALLHSINHGHVDSHDEGLLGRGQMQLWFEDLRADVVCIYLAHPAALERLGFSGIGAGGDDPANLSGFRDIGIGDRECWEPIAEGAR